MEQVELSKQHGDKILVCPYVCVTFSEWQLLIVDEQIEIILEEHPGSISVSALSGD